MVYSMQICKHVRDHILDHSQKGVFHTTTTVLSCYIIAVVGDNAALTGSVVCSLIYCTDLYTTTD